MLSSLSDILFLFVYPIRFICSSPTRPEAVRPLKECLHIDTELSNPYTHVEICRKEYIAHVELFDM